MPGVLPVLNAQVVEFAIRAGLALGCDDPPRVASSRGRTTSTRTSRRATRSRQYDLPLCEHGAARDRARAAARRRVGITRIHMEEDAGKNIHDASARRVARRLQPRRRAADRDRERARPAQRRRGGRVPQGRCATCSSTSGSTTATWRRARSAATRTSRCCRKGADEARHARRAQEHQLVPLREAGDRVRDRAPGRAARVRRQGRAGDAPLGHGRAARPARCAARKRRTTTATSPSRICRRCVVEPAQVEAARAALPELPRAKLERLAARVRALGVRREVLTADRALAEYFEALRAPR